MAQVNEIEAPAVSGVDVPAPAATPDAPLANTDLGSDDWAAAQAAVASQDAAAAGEQQLPTLTPNPSPLNKREGNTTPAADASVADWTKYYEQHGCRDWNEFDGRLKQTITDAQALQARLAAQDAELNQWREWQRAQVSQQQQTAQAAAVPAKPRYDVTKQVHEANGMSIEQWNALNLDQKNVLNMRHYLRHPDVAKELEEMYGSKLAPVADKISGWEKQAQQSVQAQQQQQYELQINQAVVNEVGALIQSAEFAGKPQMADALVAYLKPALPHLKAAIARDPAAGKQLFGMMVDGFRSKQTANVAQMGQRAAEARANQTGALGVTARPGGGGGTITKANNNAEQAFRDMAANAGVDNEHVAVLEQLADKYSL